MRATESITFKNFSTTQGPFTLLGGRYLVTMLGTSGSLSFEYLGPDGSTWIVPNSLAGAATTNSSLGTPGSYVVPVSAGQYRFAGTSPVGAYAQVTRIPQD